MAGLEAPWELTGEGNERRGRGARPRGCCRGGRPWRGGRGEAPWGCFLCASLLLFVGCLCYREGEEQREEEEREEKKKKKKKGKKEKKYGKNFKIGNF
jgi:hypothetical protein